VKRSNRGAEAIDWPTVQNHGKAAADKAKGNIAIKAGAASQADIGKLIVDLIAAAKGGQRCVHLA
jgi:hypothetical protein